MPSGTISPPNLRGAISSNMSHRDEFSEVEIDEIRSALKVLRRADPAKQKAIR